MVQTSVLLFLGVLVPLAWADNPEAKPGWGPGHGPGHGPGGPGGPGGPWQTGAPVPAAPPAGEPGCGARAACDSASAAVRSCSSRAATAATVNFSLLNSCMCQPGLSVAIQDCFSGCIGAVANIWPGGPAQCTTAAPPPPGGGGGSVTRTGTATGTGGLGGSSSRLPSGPTGSAVSSRTGTAGIGGPSGNGTVVPSRTSGASPSLPASPTGVRSGASVQMTAPMIAAMLSLILATAHVLL